MNTLLQLEQLNVSDDDGGYYGTVLLRMAKGFNTPLDPSTDVVAFAEMDVPPDGQ